MSATYTDLDGSEVGYEQFNEKLKSGGFQAQWDEDARLNQQKVDAEKKRKEDDRITQMDLEAAKNRKPKGRAATDITGAGSRDTTPESPYVAKRMLLGS